MLRSRRVLVLLALTALVACDDEDEAGLERSPTPPVLLPAPPEGDAARGRALIATYECNRCHEGSGAGAAPDDQDCVGCHQDIRAGSLEASDDALDRWRENLVSLNAAPSLTAAGARLRREWIVDFLRAPHDQRPRLPATMPRLALDETAALDIATHLVPDPSREPGPSAADGDLAAGRRLLEVKGCATCHAFGGVPALHAASLPVRVSPEKMELGMLLAPDLRHVRERFQPGALVAWLTDPAAVKPDTAMPAIPLTRRQATQVASYLLHAELTPPPVAEVPERLPLLDRPVTYEEVHERVFRRTCRHCHADPDLALGDGGPGNTGGFGFPPRRLNLGSYVGIASGAVGDDGRRHSIFAPAADGVPHIVAVLLARHAEEAGQPVDGLRGMPLGLPPVPPEDIQLVDTWIAQGRPR